MKKTTLKEKASKKIEDWKKDISHLENQLEHTQEEAKISFEKQKKNLVNWIDGVKKEVDKLEGFSEEKAKDLQGKLDELRVQAALGKAEAKDACQDRQKQLNHSIHNTKVAISKMEKTASKDAKVLLEKSNHTLDTYQTKFDLFQFQMTEKKENFAQTLHDQKKEISMRLSKMKAKLGEAKDDTADRWEHFSDELSEAWKHVKKSIKDQ